MAAAPTLSLSGAEAGGSKRASPAGVRLARADGDVGYSHGLDDAPSFAPTAAGPELLRRPYVPSRPGRPSGLALAAVSATPFDVVFADGRFRIFCLVRALRLAHVQLAPFSSCMTTTASTTTASRRGS